jgi:hypothetical protein
MTINGQRLALVDFVEPSARGSGKIGFVGMGSHSGWFLQVRGAWVAAGFARRHPSRELERTLPGFFL